MRVTFQSPTRIWISFLSKFWPKVGLACEKNKFLCSKVVRPPSFQQRDVKLRFPKSRIRAFSRGDGGNVPSADKAEEANQLHVCALGMARLRVTTDQVLKEPAPKGAQQHPPAPRPLEDSATSPLGSAPLALQRLL